MSEAEQDRKSGPRCFKTQAQRWASIMGHCLRDKSRGANYDRGLTVLPTPNARWAQVLKRGKAESLPKGREQDALNGRRLQVKRAAKKGDELARYVLAVAKLLDVRLEEGENAIS